jgi:hypothetical protein
LVDEEVAAGGSLPQVVARVARREYRAGATALAEREAVFDGRRVRVPGPVATWGYQGLIVETVADLCEAETDLVVELGAGWGRNLFLLWTLGGPPRARYVAAEYTESGCRAAGRLAELEPSLDFATVRFDYHAPRLEGLAGARHAVVFSAHSVEQVPELPSAVVELVRSLAPRVSCVHFEPVGWQLDDDGAGEGSTGHYATEHDYNRNLVSLLREQEQAGLVELVSLRAEAVGVNPANATTVVGWSSTQPS